MIKKETVKQVVTWIATSAVYVVVESALKSHVTKPKGFIKGALFALGSWLIVGAVYEKLVGPVEKQLEEQFEAGKEIIDEGIKLKEVIQTTKTEEGT